ncbi:MAG: alpha/beta hydrolase family protein [Candidatus Bathyarchaeia archaeon]|jgi:pimeloyl-ACP methyl ester carboxylesterase
MPQNQQIENKETQWIVDEIPVYGTLTYPKSEKTCGAVVFVAGSGPTDRDWCSPLLPGTNGSGKLLAEALAHQGFLTLRYDKRASGPHAKEAAMKLKGKISMQSHVDELAGAVKTIVAERQGDDSDLFVLSSSEGAIHALNYQLEAKQHRFRGFVLTGAPGRAVGQVARSQIFSQVAALPDAESTMKYYDAAIAAFVEGKPVVPDASLPEGMKQLLLSLATPFNLPFARELWIYNPAKAIAKLDAPLLVVIGKKDIQTDWQADGKPLEAAAAKNGLAEFVYPENANHILKHEETPREKLDAQAALHYNASDRVLDQEAAGAIFEWLNKQTSEA